MIAPKFNQKTIIKELVINGEHVQNGVKGGQPMLPKALYNIKPHDPTKEHSCLMMFDNGYRVTNDTLKYEDWNGCHFDDIDYKVWIDYCNEHMLDYADPVKVFKDVWIWLLDRCPTILYYMEYSKSKEGFHIVTYFDVEKDCKTMARWFYTKAISVALVRQAFIECGYAEAIDYCTGPKGAKVHDSCSVSPLQLMHFTGMGKINDKCTGIRGEYGDAVTSETSRLYDLYMSKKCKKEDDDPIKQQEAARWVYDIVEVDDDIKTEYIDHYARWSLFNSLYRVVRDKRMLKEEWERCCNKLVEANGHTYGWYCKEPYKNDWEDKLDGTEFCDLMLLKMFGYEIKTFKKKKSGMDALNIIENL